MNDKTPTRQMFPESRAVLAVFSPILGASFCCGAYFTSVWQPSNLSDKLLKYGILCVISVFITLCIVGFIAAIVGPRRIQPLVDRVGGLALKAGFVLMAGGVYYLIHYWSDM